VRKGEAERERERQRSDVGNCRARKKYDRESRQEKQAEGRERGDELRDG